MVMISMLFFLTAVHLRREVRHGGLMLGELRLDVSLYPSYTLFVLFFHISSLLEFIQQKVMFINSSLIEIDRLLQQYLAVHHLFDPIQWLVEQFVDDSADFGLEREPMHFQISS